MTKLEELKAALEAATEAVDDVDNKYCAAYDAYHAELKKQEKGTNNG